MIALLMVFTTSEVMAQAFAPQSCTAGTYTIQTVPNHFPLVISSTADPNYANYPCTTCPFPYYVFEYSVIGDVNGINRIGEIFPVCQNQILVYATSPQSSHVFDPGVFDNVLNWPVGMYDGFTLSWTASPSSGKFWVATNTPGVDINSMTLKAGKYIYYCTNGIAGPGCGLPGFVPVNLTAKIRLGPSEICVSKDPATGCINDVYECDGSYHYPLIPIQDIQVGGSALQWAGGDSEQRCPTVILFTESSMPRCYTIGSGGSACVKCYCCSNTQCANKGLTTCAGVKAGCTEVRADLWGSCQ